MRRILLVMVGSLVLSGCVADRNVPKPRSIAEAMSLPQYQEILKGVEVYFGDQPHPTIEKKFRTRSANRRSNATGDSGPDASCARAFVSAVVRLHRAAVREGGNAVVNIRSNYKHNEVSSRTHYQCATGVLMSGVTLKGTLVKLRK